MLARVWSMPKDGIRAMARVRIGIRAREVARAWATARAM